MKRNAQKRGSKRSVDERRRLRAERRAKKLDAESEKVDGLSGKKTNDHRIASLLARNEDELLEFVAKINQLYQEKLKKPAPFMTFVFCGMQSAGKSTIMERFLNGVLNIVQEGTGTRCPLDTTCIHDASCSEPRCRLSGTELLEHDAGDNLTVQRVFESITKHNQTLGKEDRFSTAPLFLEYRASNVQNMRFVDTPGIISNRSKGKKDNREQIKMILQSEMHKDNAKLCVLLEPKEFDTNPIVNFCDETFVSRDAWTSDATFLMTKFDNQMHNSKAPSKANAFFESFHSQNCFPHLVITPTLPRENLESGALYQARKELLASADAEEKSRFDAWLQDHAVVRRDFPIEPELNEKVASKLGFLSAKKVMREIMLTDTATRLPEVLESLRFELKKCQEERDLLAGKLKFNDPKELKLVITQALVATERKITDYLDGDLEFSLKFPEKLQTLEEELEEEEESDWVDKKLHVDGEDENGWRDRIFEMDDDFRKQVYADNKYFGGKQYQRALELFRAIMIDSLPDPFALEKYVPNGTGYLCGGLERENWERAMVQIVKVSIKEVTHPGINYFVKHVGSLFRRFFVLALEDIKQGESMSSTFRLMPRVVEKRLKEEFDTMLWKLMESVAEKTHGALEPMYTSIDPDLPTFHPKRFAEDDDKKEDRYKKMGDTFELIEAQAEEDEDLGKSVGKMFQGLFAKMISGNTEAKDLLKQENRKRATSKKCFLQDERTAMVTREETKKIIFRSFEYMVALMNYNIVFLKFNFNHFLYEGFKKLLHESLVSSLTLDAVWDELVVVDESLKDRVAELDDQIRSLKDTQSDVYEMQRGF